MFAASNNFAFFLSVMLVQLVWGWGVVELFAFFLFIIMFVTDVIINDF